ncbi:MAG: hypothetical protein F4X18_11820 [Acidimicrobiia bacterium]|nr:hypothetical protein [Acidimicrobiia bacterium]MYC86180.1 hypothetical protein [Acidimicrobiia bacterium]
MTNLLISLVGVLFSALFVLLWALIRSFRAEMGGLRAEMGGLRIEMGGLRTDMGALRSEVKKHGERLARLETLVSLLVGPLGAARADPGTGESLAVGLSARRSDEVEPD